MKGGGRGRGFLGQRTSSSSSTFGSLFVINTSSRPRSDKSRSESLIIGSTEGSLVSSRVRVLRNDEIRFGGSRSKANIFISGDFKEAPIVGSRGWYTGSLSFFTGEDSFCGLTYGSGWGGIKYVMPGKIPLGLKGL